MIQSSKGLFLPKSRIRTTVWWDNKSEVLPWEVTQDKINTKQFKGYCVEINMNRVAEKYPNYDQMAMRMVELWINLKTLMGTRMDLENRKIRGMFSNKAEAVLYQANREVINMTPELKKYYTQSGLTSILKGTWSVDTWNVKARDNVLIILKNWYKSGLEDPSGLLDKDYLRMATQNEIIYEGQESPNQKEHPETELQLESEPLPPGNPEPVEGSDTMLLLRDEVKSSDSPDMSGMQSDSMP